MDNSSPQQKFPCFCSCGQGYSVLLSQAGKTVKCKKCGQPFTIQLEPQSTATPMPVHQPGSSSSVPTPAAPAESAQPRLEQHASINDSVNPRAAESFSTSVQEPPAVVPWQIPAQLAEKAAAYDQSQKYESYYGEGNEYLNAMLKNYLFRDLQYPLELRIYPDLAGVRLYEPPGCLASLIDRCPDAVKTVLFPLFWILNFMIAAPFGVFSMLIGLAALAAVIFVLFLALAEAFWGTIIVIALIAGGIVAYNHFMQQRLEYIIRRVLEDPKSSFSIKCRFKFSGVAPRLWQKGDVVQLVRLDTHRKMKKRSLILLVQDSPFPAQMGCMQTGAGALIGKYLKAERRIFVLSINDGQARADQAAQALSRLFALEIQTAKFVFNNFRFAQ